MSKQQIAVGPTDTILINPYNCGRRPRAPPQSISAVHTAGAPRPPRVVLGESPSSLTPWPARQSRPGRRGTECLHGPSLTALAALPRPATRTHHHQGQLDALLAHTRNTKHRTTTYHSRLVSFHFYVNYERLEATHTQTLAGAARFLARHSLHQQLGEHRWAAESQSEREPRQRWPRIPRVAKTCNSVHL